MRLERGQRRLHGQRSAGGIEAEVPLEVRGAEARQRLEIDRADGIDEAGEAGTRLRRDTRKGGSVLRIGDRVAGAEFRRERGELARVAPDEMQRF